MHIAGKGGLGISFSETRQGTNSWLTDVGAVHVVNRSLCGRAFGILDEATPFARWDFDVGYHAERCKIAVGVSFEFLGRGKQLERVSASFVERACRLIPTFEAPLRSQTRSIHRQTLSYLSGP